MNTFTPLTDVKSVLSILSHISIFGGVTELQRDEIFRRLESTVVRKGDYVFRQGDEPSHIYIVKSGAIDLLFSDNHVVLEKKELRVGECFGHVALISMNKHTLAAVAIEDAEIIVLSRRALIQLKHENLELFALLIMNIARELARRLIFTDAMLLRAMHKQEEIEKPG